MTLQSFISITLFGKRHFYKEQIVTKLFIVILLNFCDSKVKNKRLMGSTDASINDHRYLLSLQGEHHYCGACILTESKGLTAAHCTEGRDPNILSVRAGSNHTEDGGELIQVSDVKPHPNFDLNTLAYDIAILILVTPITIGVRVNLPPVNQVVPEGATAVVAGWGAAKPNAGEPNAVHLQKIEINRITDEKCNSSYYGFFASSMFCFAAPNKGLCWGDHGSPLVHAGNQVGIVSWGYGCARPAYPGVYTKIANCEINSYIVQQINEENYY
ncbi:hypothetical protein RN001_010721 [Aquatica leii]|uniref:Peptidase S1 domain-containing protein n=1 Tax=Aquatica leii TaxID=1421715 RepID=A0AAN7P1D5_9COLE|nr:hypothetical protein RN001_010721 [Aquatica leii]